MSFEPRFATLADIYDHSIATYASRELFGTKKGQRGVWTTYREFGSLVDRLRGGVWVRRPQPLPAAPPEEEVVDLGEVSLFDLLSALRQTLQRYDKEHPPPMLVTADGVSELKAPVNAPPGIAHVENWPVSEARMVRAASRACMSE